MRRQWDTLVLGCVYQQHTLSCYPVLLVGHPGKRSNFSKGTTAVSISILRPIILNRVLQPCQFPRSFHTCIWSERGLIWLLCGQGATDSHINKTEDILTFNTNLLSQISLTSTLNISLCSTWKIDTRRDRQPARQTERLYGRKMKR